MNKRKILHLFVVCLGCQLLQHDFAFANDADIFKRGLESQTKPEAAPKGAPSNNPRKRELPTRSAKPSACQQASSALRQASAAQASAQQLFQARRATADARTAICEYMKRDLPNFRRQSAAYVACPSLDPDGSKKAHADKGVAGAISIMRLYSC